VISLVAIRARIERGELTPGAAIRESLEAVGRYDSDIRAFVATNAAPAVGARSKPLSGIAIGVKDIYDTTDMPTQMGSEIYAGWQPKGDAALVMMARKAGASIVGKTATTAFAHMDPTTTRNPHNLAHTPGGSSSGSAAAVAAGMVPLAFGTQTGGSVIRPASFCGVAGMKPSFRLLPTAGIKCYSGSLDTAGLFAATVADVLVALRSLTDRDFAQPDKDRPLRVGVARQSFAGPAEEDSQTALAIASQAFSDAGAIVNDKDDPKEFGAAWEHHSIMADGEALRSLAWEWETHRDLMPVKLCQALKAAEDIAPSRFDEARRISRRARLAARAFFSDVDAVLTFSAPGAAPNGLGSTGDAKFNRLWTLLGVPCINVPVHHNSHALPIGVQIIAPFGFDSVALATALLLERELAAVRT
jgi:Asp-tRNA(Asn)/Glu-tRNA(Gln) amidotransferase A subunit family amidase